MLSNEIRDAIEENHHHGSVLLSVFVADHWAAKVSMLEDRLKQYQKAVNEIDDYFEYRHESITDAEMVKEILKDLTEAIRASK